VDVRAMTPAPVHTGKDHGCPARETPCRRRFISAAPWRGARSPSPLPHVLRRTATRDWDPRATPASTSTRTAAPAMTAAVTSARTTPA
jgi:hypothetical protein